MVRIEQKSSTELEQARRKNDSDDRWENNGLSPTHDMKVKDEIERLAREYGKLKEPWVFVSR